MMAKRMTGGKLSRILRPVAIAISVCAVALAGVQLTNGRVKPARICDDHASDKAETRERRVGFVGL